MNGNTIGARENESTFVLLQKPIEFCVCCAHAHERTPEGEKSNLATQLERASRAHTKDARAQAAKTLPFPLCSRSRLFLLCAYWCVRIRASIISSCERAREREREEVEEEEEEEKGEEKHEEEMTIINMQRRSRHTDQVFKVRQSDARTLLLSCAPSVPRLRCNRRPPSSSSNNNNSRLLLFSF